MKMTIDYDKDQLSYALANALKERDEAREKMADALQEVDLRTLDFERMKQERDEARIDAQKSKAYKRVLKETNLRQTERIRYLEGATNHACGTPLSVALKERDEAREAFVIATDQMVIAQSNLREANKERDEAREEAHRFRSLHYSHLGINGSASWFPWEEKLDNV
jgi:hypothetical protein